MASCGAQLIAFVNSNGAVINNYGYLAWPTHTGTACTNGAAITWTAAPTGGTTIVGTITVITPSTYFPSSNVLTGSQGLVTALQQRGVLHGDSTSGGGNFVETDGSAVNDSVASSIFSKVHALMNPMLFEVVDISGLINSKLGGVGSWEVDSTNATVGSLTQNQAVISACLVSTPTTCSYQSISLQSVGVGLEGPSGSTMVNIAADTPAYTPRYWVTGDPGNHGVTWSVVSGSDNCAGDSLSTSTGAYTPPTAANLASNTTCGLVIQATSKQDTNASGFLRINVFGVDSSGNVRIDTSGPGTTNDGLGNPWTPDPGILETPATYKTDGSWPYATFATSGLGSIYRSFAYTTEDIKSNIVMPNGNYWVTILTGSGLNGSSPTSQAGVPNHAFGVFLTQNHVQRWNWCYPCRSNFVYGIPDVVTLPAKVTNGELVFMYAGYSPDTIAGGHVVGPFDFKGNPGQGYETPQLSGVTIINDNGSTTPHWEIGTYDVDRFTQGDQYNLAPSQSVMLYVRNVFTTATGTDSDTAYSIVSGPGTISKGTIIHSGGFDQTQSTSAASQGTINSIAAGTTTPSFATPSTGTSAWYSFAQASPLSVSAFGNGAFVGQIVYLVGNPNITWVNGGTLVTVSGANEAANANTMYQFVYTATGVWTEKAEVPYPAYNYALPDSVNGYWIYTAPTTQVAGNTCAIVKAQSISTPSVSATQKICTAGTLYRM